MKTFASRAGAVQKGSETPIALCPAALVLPAIPCNRQVRPDTLFSWSSSVYLALSAVRGGVPPRFQGFGAIHLLRAGPWQQKRRQ
jgi:hypothetical protein